MTVGQALIKWYQDHKRDLPWRKTQDPYKIWVSEIILQQTRIEQGINYYYRFIERFPDVYALARAKIEEVMKLWQGLGYYNRARNMHEAAQFIADQNNGRFPQTYGELLSLKGVGPYSAAAIASFAYKEPVPVLDGNVARVISRMYYLTTPVNSTTGKKELPLYVEELMDKNQPDLFNQAVMELGALICLPKNPRCDRCPLAKNCIAFHQEITDQLPVKEKKGKMKDRYFHYLIIEDAEGLFFQYRKNQDIWRSLYEFPLIESTHMMTRRELKNHPQWKKIMPASFRINKLSDEVVHQLTHQRIHAVFVHIKLTQKAESLKNNYLQVAFNELHKIAIPRMIDRYMKNTKWRKYF